MESSTEEDYIKAILKLSEDGNSVNTNSIAEKLKTKASSVTDMIQKLSDKKLVNYVKYQGVTLTDKGKEKALNIIRKHRLWEHFLVNKLQFTWDEIHEIAEQLEHIQSQKLIDKLDEYLNYPKFDPHGDPIPDKNGKIYPVDEFPLCELKINDSGILVNVREHSSDFLKFLESIPLMLGSKINLIERFPFDRSIKVLVNDSKEITLSHQVASLLRITQNKEHAQHF